MYNLSSQQPQNICCFVPEISCDWLIATNHFYTAYSFKVIILKESNTLLL